MQTIIIRVKDEKKTSALVSFLKEISFIDIEKGEQVKTVKSKNADFRKLFGIWENRDITLADIRKKAWRQ